MNRYKHDYYNAWDNCFFVADERRVVRCCCRRRRKQRSKRNNAFPLCFVTTPIVLLLWVFVVQHSEGTEIISGPQVRELLRAVPDSSSGERFLAAPTDDDVEEAATPRTVQQQQLAQEGILPTERQRHRVSAEEDDNTEEENLDFSGLFQAHPPPDNNQQQHSDAHENEQQTQTQQHRFDPFSMVFQLDEECDYSLSTTRGMEFSCAFRELCLKNNGRCYESIDLEFLATSENQTNVSACWTGSDDREETCFSVLVDDEADYYNHLNSSSTAKSTAEPACGVTHGGNPCECRVCSSSNNNNDNIVVPSVYYDCSDYNTNATSGGKCVDLETIIMNIATVDGKEINYRSSVFDPSAATNNDYQPHCIEGYGPNCESFLAEDDEECESLRCENKGVCRRGNNTNGSSDIVVRDVDHLNLYHIEPNHLERCVCPPGYIGLRCEHEVHVCSGGGSANNNDDKEEERHQQHHYCLHGSRCVVSQEGVHFCDCTTTTSKGLFAGASCEYNATEICTTTTATENNNNNNTNPSPSFCVNGGACVRKVSVGERHAGCNCLYGYDGIHCEVRIEDNGPEQHDNNGQAQKESSDEQERTKDNNDNNTNLLHNIIYQGGGDNDNNNNFQRVKLTTRSFFPFLGVLVGTTLLFASLLLVRRRRKQQQQRRNRSIKNDNKRDGFRDKSTSVVVSLSPNHNNVAQPMGHSNNNDGPTKQQQKSFESSNNTKDTVFVSVDDLTMESPPGDVVMPLATNDMNGRNNNGKVEMTVMMESSSDYTTAPDII